MYGMKKRPYGRRTVCAVLLLLTAAVFTFSGTLLAEKKPNRKPPETKKVEVREEIHGVGIVDPYRWLEDQQSPETREWIDSQNEYSHSFIDDIPGREKLHERLTELMKTDRIGMPIERDGRYFLSKRSADQDLFIIYMREGLDGEDEVLIDPHTMSPDLTTSVGLLDVSNDGTLLAYQVREGGEDEFVVRLMDIESRTDIEDVLPKGRYYGLSITPAKDGLYYARHDAGEGSRVYYHAMGTDPGADEMLFGEGFGAGIGIGAGLSEDGRYLIITVFHGSAAEKTEVYYKDLKTGGPIKPVVNDINARFYPGVGGNLLFLQTNWEAPNGRMLAVDLNDPARQNWKEIIPETDGVMQGFSTAGGRLFVNYLENVVSKVKVYESSGEFVRDIKFPTLGSVSGVRGQWDRNEAFFVFSSFHIPTTIYRYDVKSGVQEVWAKLKVPAKTDNIEVKQAWYESKDGTDVPMFIVHSKDIVLDGNNPTLLMGYGGFTVSLTPRFSSTAVLWTEKGGVFAMPNLRGGGEFGEEWHKAGMREKKQNVFDDFIAAAEWLIENKYTNSTKLAIAGGSNGGLLVGAVMTQRPELFKAVVCSYPLLDMVRYHKFLVAEFWVPEYGSSEDPDQFAYIYEYSPYHRVSGGVEYPATLFITGDSDTRVAPLHARKMTALLQAETGSDDPILLLYDTKAGHSGGRPLSKQIEDDTDEMSFLFWQLDMK